MPYALREALAAFRRAPLLVIVSMISVSLSLFVVGLFALTAYNIRAVLQEIEERVEVVAYLRDGTATAQAGQAAEEIRRLPEVLEVRYVSKTEALATAIEELPEFRENLSGLDTNPLPAALEVRLRPGYRTTEATERLARSIGAYPFVEETSYGREWVAKIVSLERIAAGATLVIGGAFAGVAGIIIATAVRIAVFARRDEIDIMRLVGATDSFIRRPFLIEGFLTGLLGGIAAIGITYLAYYFVTITLIRILWLPSLWLAAMVAFGAAFGLFSSALAVRRHLRTL
jgi:cell division transport system permease protein